MAPRWMAGPGRSFTPFFRVIRNTKTVRGASQMIRYVAFRSKDLEGKEKGAFGPETDHADVKAFIKDLPDRLTRHPWAPKAFHCLLSLNREEFERIGLTDWKEVTREVLRTYERETGRKLTLTKEDLRQFRRATGRVLAYHRAQARALERAAGMRLQQIRTSESFMRSLWRMIDQERARREREADRAHQRWLRGDDER